MHATDNRKGDMASLPLDYLVNRGVVVDISSKMSDWAVITPDMIESAGADIREGDILILHTGWHRHYEGQSQQDLVKYFCYHPGPNLDTLHWMFEKKIKWWGMDTGPSNTSTRNPSAGSWPTSSRFTTGRSRKACCTPRISAAISSSCSTSAR
jgi:kynurenine formamidase